MISFFKCGSWKKLKYFSISVTALLKWKIPFFLLSVGLCNCHVSMCLLISQCLLRTSKIMSSYSSANVFFLHMRGHFRYLKKPQDKQKNILTRNENPVVPMFLLFQSSSRLGLKSPDKRAVLDLLVTVLNPLAGTVFFPHCLNLNSYVCRSKRKKLKVDGGVMCAEKLLGFLLLIFAR